MKNNPPNGPFDSAKQRRMDFFTLKRKDNEGNYLKLFNYVSNILESFLYDYNRHDATVSNMVLWI